jgi:hypothetical protein
MELLMTVAPKAFLAPGAGVGRPVFAKKDWRFRGAHADRRNENRFIFFSGVVA